MHNSKISNISCSCKYIGHPRILGGLCRILHNPQPTHSNNRERDKHDVITKSLKRDIMQVCNYFNCKFLPYFVSFHFVFKKDQIICSWKKNVILLVKLLHKWRVYVVLYLFFLHSNNYCIVSLTGRHKWSITITT